jgi:hypothetical protein
VEPGTTLEDCPNGRLIFALAAQDLQPEVAKAIRNELHYRLEELLAWHGGYLAFFWRLEGVMRRVRNGSA